eukprot:5342701-Amphidinium_carterae.1
MQCNLDIPEMENDFSMNSICDAISSLSWSLQADAEINDSTRGPLSLGRIVLEQCGGRFCLDDALQLNSVSIGSAKRANQEIPATNPF